MFPSGKDLLVVALFIAIVGFVAITVLVKTAHYVAHHLAWVP